MRSTHINQKKSSLTVVADMICVMKELYVAQDASMTGPNIGKQGLPADGTFCSTPKKVVGLENKYFVIDVACGDNHSLAL